MKYRTIYGINPLREALRAGRDIRNLYVMKGRRIPPDLISLIKKRGLKMTHVGKAFFSSFPKGHQGLAAEVSTEKDITIRGLFEISERREEPPLYLMVDGVTDPHNLGAILRTAEVSGVHGVILEKRRVATGETVSKASAGAVEYLPVIRVTNLKHLLPEIKDRGVTVVGGEAEAGEVLWEADLGGPLALIVGSEGKGIRRTVREACDILVRIPVYGHLNSLNVSVAAGVLLYEIRRQRSLSSMDYEFNR